MLVHLAMSISRESCRIRGKRSSGSAVEATAAMTGPALQGDDVGSDGGGGGELIGEASEATTAAVQLRENWGFRIGRVCVCWTRRVDGVKKEIGKKYENVKHI